MITRAPFLLGAPTTRRHSIARPLLNGYKLPLPLHNHNNRLPNNQGEPQAAAGLVSSTRYLTIQRARESDSGLYECVASNAHDNDLRKLVHVQVRGE